MTGIEIRGLSKAYPACPRALDAVDLDVKEGELIAVVGPSGSGKTTLLRLIAGLETPSAGLVQIRGKDLAGVPPHRRNVAMVFQNLALYQHLPVRENLAFGLNGKGDQEVKKVAEMLGIGHLLDRFPAELSG